MLVDSRRLKNLNQVFFITFVSRSFSLRPKLVSHFRIWEINPSGLNHTDDALSLLKLHLKYKG